QPPHPPASLSNASTTCWPSCASSATRSSARSSARGRSPTTRSNGPRDVGFFGGTAVYVEPGEEAADLLARAAERLDGSGRLVEPRMLEGPRPTAEPVVAAADGSDP